MIALGKLTFSGRDVSIKTNSKVEDNLNFIEGVKVGDCNEYWLGKMIYQNKAYKEDGSILNNNNNYFTGGPYENKHIYCEKTENGQYKWVAYN